MILWHGGKLDLIFEAEGRIYLVKQTDDILYLVLHLIPSHEDMSIILSKAADAEESVQCTGELMTVYKTKLADAVREITV